jgi:2-C-methyl-D-erythritol 4-phosphate cytidylyltransferase
MATYTVLVLTAAPPGQTAESGGAFVKIDGRESVIRAIELFLNRDNVKQIYVAFLPEVAEEAKKRHGAHLSFSGVKVLSGGPRWMDQIAAAKDKIAAESTHVIVHDGARPAVPYTDIDAMMEATETVKKPAIALITPLRTALVEVDEGGTPVSYHLPTQYVQLLTPQLFTRARFEQMASSGTEVHPSELALLKGSPLNVRLGGPGDATVVKSMINMLPKPKIKAASPFEEAQW